ncbi:hypothetical protein [Streptomyces sp. NPDC002490]|uniref:hypothetical protein n=1 Tax=Streptomyces sp. NPDC002490 TaxID=3154416 RepID=UPI00332772AE
MPFPLPSRARSGPRRRSLLAGAAGTVLLTGCTADGDDGPAGAARKQSSAAERARRSTAEESRALGALYDRVGTAHPALAERLAPLRAAVARHEAAFARVGASPSPTAPPSPSASAPAAPPPVPDDPRGALAALAERERKLAGARTERALEVPGELARLLASVAAAGAAHVYLLTEGEK